jgi:hypothetical protein
MWPLERSDEFEGAHAVDGNVVDRDAKPLRRTR